MMFCGRPVDEQILGGIATQTLFIDPKKKSHINGGILIVHHLVKRAHIESKFSTLGTLQGQHTDP